MDNCSHSGSSFGFKFSANMDGKADKPVTGEVCKASTRSMTAIHLN